MQGDPTTAVRTADETPPPRYLRLQERTVRSRRRDAIVYRVRCGGCGRERDVMEGPEEIGEP